MPSDPGWYRDPRRPGMRRYWDGHEWVDVDQVVRDDTHPPAQAEARAPRLVSQRGPHPEPAVDLDEAASSGEGEPLPD